MSSQGTQSNSGILQSPQELHSRHSKPPPPPNQAQIATPLPGSEGLTAAADAGGCVWAAACQGVNWESELPARRMVVNLQISWQLGWSKGHSQEEWGGGLPSRIHISPTPQIPLSAIPKPAHRPAPEEHPIGPLCRGEDPPLQGFSLGVDRWLLILSHRPSGNWDAEMGGKDWPQPPTAPKGASDAKLCALYKEAELRLKGSSNTTECVPVPTSEHVAEIVGRQGCKIKALRAKTNTYIKTPVRGEEPVFMVTGRREDVATARREIISAAEHFSMIRASRNKSGAAFGVAPALPGQVTIRVRVPYRVVGLVVGPKGATIKRIQQQTNTYIITPSRDRDPVFEITGAPGNVERAREEIETHIAVRTGKILEYNNENDFLAGSPDAALDSRYSDAWRVHPPGCKPLSTFRQNSLGCIGECGVDSGFEAPRLGEQGGDFGYGGYLFPGYGVGKQDVYYGVAETSPPLWAGQENATPTSVLFSSASSSSSSSAKARAGPPGAHRSPATSAGPELAGLPRRPPGEPLQGFSKLGGGGLRSPGGGRDCMVCFESEVTAALVPCGHNLFCMECAVRICERTDPECPVCHITATQAIRIFS
ncbi:PREDICTED: RNA-binding protein MEX3A [Mandrillus leucophaeus]|uniref:RNA-binding protein MEX3A n=1 Tax=Mandrillus leucophaeus TaxID=9568 RepID=UPI0005F56A51|nr:PREDICTED: RNA-binding protein MEX3A [Mandrillus leucophaeus]